MTSNPPDRVLIVDRRPIFRETLARELRDAGCDVLAADTGERAFVLLRDRSQRIGWVYAQAALSGLIDGWILADEYRDATPGRSAVLAACGAKSCAQGHIVLEQPGPAAVAGALGRLIREDRTRRQPKACGAEQRRAA